MNGATITASQAAMLHPAVITQVVETGGDNETTDTIIAQWTGQTFINGVANEPLPNTAADAPYTVGWFADRAPAFVDRNHLYTHASETVLIPSYLLGGEYIMSGNDNRDNNDYRLDVTVSQPVDVYMLIDNRLGDPNSSNTTPPALGPTRMQWILDEGWTPVTTGNNRAGSNTDPDEIGIDEGADGSINQWYSIYRKSFPAGTFQLKQPNNAGQNMYGAVVTPQESTAPAGSLEIALETGNIIITFPSGFRLQRAATLSAPITWEDVEGASPFTVPSGSAAGFYRGVSP